MRALQADEGLGESDNEAEAARTNRLMGLMMPAVRRVTIRYTCCSGRAISIGWTIGQSPGRVGGATSARPPLGAQHWYTCVGAAKRDGGGEPSVIESDIGEGRAGEDVMSCVEAIEIIGRMYT
jgi:hypothetical protein